jgi:hypothetical protein
MPLYTFFPTLPDGKSLTFETYELPHDVAAKVFALTVLDRHPTCACVVVWTGERDVCTRCREPTS